MFYLVRSPDGTVQTVSRQPLPGSTAVDDSSAELAEFLGRTPSTRFDAADAEFVRVIEDLIDTLITKNVIRHTDLPAPAQAKLLQRKGLRSRISGALDFLGRDERLL